jgi:DNA-binding NarL/FixJ family response regulator
MHEFIRHHLGPLPESILDTARRTRQLETPGCLGVSVAVEDERRAIAYVEENLEISESRGDRYYRTYSLLTLSIAAWQEGDRQRGTALVRQALAMSIDDHSRAATLLGVAHALADAMGIPEAIPPYLAGMGMSPDETVAYAIKPTLENEPPRLLQVNPPLMRPEQPAAEEATGEQQRPRLRVLIVDHHRMEADGIQRVFDQHPDLKVVGIATNSGDAVALAAATHPDVILADYQLPDSTGAELAARLRKDEPATRVLLLSSVASEPLLKEAVKAGAKGFLLRTQPAEELVEAVRRAGAGEMLIPAVRLAAMLADSDRGAQLFDQLTGREREVLRLLAAGLENKAIAARMGIGYVTVRSHVRNLCSKLDARSRLEVLAKASELGLIER